MSEEAACFISLPEGKLRGVASAYLMRAIDELLWGENDWPPVTVIGLIV